MLRKVYCSSNRGNIFLIQETRESLRRLIEKTTSCTIDLNAMKSMCKVQEGRSQFHGKAGFQGKLGQADVLNNGLGLATLARRGGAELSRHWEDQKQKSGSMKFQRLYIGIYCCLTNDPQI